MDLPDLGECFKRSASKVWTPPPDPADLRTRVNDRRRRRALFSAGLGLALTGIVGLLLWTLLPRGGGGLPAVGEPAAKLSLEQVVPGDHPIEGFISQLMVLDDSGSVVFSHGYTVLNGRLGRVELPSGSYRVEASTRVCNANCSNLAPPAPRCAASVRLGPGQVVDAMLRIDFDRTTCRITASEGTASG